MSRIFLSHSSANELEVVAMQKWLAENGWDDVFLDLDPQRGLLAGERWQEALRRAASRCEAVLFIVTPEWAQSKWCLAEFLLAKSLNKRIFGAILKPIAINELPTELTAEWQLCNLVVDGPSTLFQFAYNAQACEIEWHTNELARLRNGLANAGLDTRHFPWPPSDEPQRSPYRGLAALGEKDAAVFFGRDAQIVRGLDALRGMRATGIEKLFVILGPSGTGKSSFLRAGLVPRLKRDDRHFFPLEIIRPEHNPITGDNGLVNALHTANKALDINNQAPGDIKSTLMADVNALAPMLAQIQHKASLRLRLVDQDAAPPTLLLCIDQAEELFNADFTQNEARHFLNLIGQALRQDAQRLSVIVAFTIHSDRYEPLQTAPELTGLTSQIFDDLKPLPIHQFREVILGPALRATNAGSRLEIAPDLVERMVKDCAQGADTLPLLALTLERLYKDYGSDGNLELHEYDKLGGIDAVINTEIESLLSPNDTERQSQLEALRAAFIPWLATVNPQNDEPLRRLARYSDLPVASQPLIDALAEKRLLLIDKRNSEKVVEVAHESLLRKWDVLAKKWLPQYREQLKLADNLEVAAADWTGNKQRDPWLWSGERLAAGEALVFQCGFQQRLAACHDFLAASRRAEESRREEEEKYRQDELQAAQQLAAEQSARADVEQKARVAADASSRQVRRRSRLLIAATFLMAGALVAAGIFYQRVDKQNRLIEEQLKQATALRLTAEGSAMVSTAHPGGAERGLQQLLAAHRLSPSVNADVGLLTTVLLTQYLQKIISTSASISDIALSPDGSRIVSGSYDNTLRLWDANTGQPIGEPLEGHEQPVLSVAFSPDGRRIVSGSWDNTLRLWDANTGEPLGEPLRSHEDWVASVAFSPDGSRIVSGGGDNTLRLWDGNTGKLLGEPLRGHESMVTSVAFSPDGRRIVSGSGDKTLRLWDAITGQPLGEPLRGHEESVVSVAFSPDGSRIVSGSGDTTLRLWDANTGQPIGEPLKGHEDWVYSVAFSPDGSRIVSGSQDKTLRLWDAITSKPIGEPLKGHESTVYSVAFSPDGSRILSGGRREETLRLWDGNTFKPLGEPLKGHEQPVLSVAFSPDGSRIVSGSDDKTLRLWDAITGKPLGEPLEGHEQPVLSVAFSPDGRHIVSGSKDKTLRLWDANTGQPIGAPLEGHEESVGSVAFSPDGRHIVSGGGWDKTLRLWDGNTGKPLGEPLKGHEEWVSSVAFSPDGSRIVSGSGDKTLRLWDAITGKPLGEPLKGHESTVYSVAFSPDGRRIVSGSDDKTLRLWDANTGEPFGEPLRGHEQTVVSVAFSPDGSRIVSGSADSTLRLWDAITGKPLGEPLRGHENWVASVAFSPDGSRIVSGSHDNTLRLWPAPKVWPDLLCAKLTRNMSHRQWREWVSPNIGFVVQCPNLPIPEDEPDAGKE